MKKTLVIVGAGPGDPELITVKGLMALKKAEVILYDAVSSVELL
jgi:uroporphyrin-III C-methyltransferase